MPIVVIALAIIFLTITVTLILYLQRQSRYLWIQTIPWSDEGIQSSSWIKSYWQEAWNLYPFWGKIASIVGTIVFSYVALFSIDEFWFFMSVLFGIISLILLITAYRIVSQENYLQDELRIGQQKKLMETSLFSGILSDHERATYSGVITLPHKVYQGDAHQVHIDLNRNLIIGIIEEAKPSFDVENLQEATLSFERRYQEHQWLEVELQAAGISIDGDRIQRQSLDANQLSFQWSCLFDQFGRREIILNFSVPSKINPINLGQIKQQVKVRNLLGMTQKQLWVVATLSSVITLVLSILDNINSLFF